MNNPLFPITDRNQSLLGHHTNQSSNVITGSLQVDWIALTFTVTLIVTSWMLNVTFVASIVRDSKLRRLTYYYLISNAILNLVHATLNFPSNLLFDIIGKSDNSNKACLVWIFTETLVGHVTVLHLLGSALDAYLNLSQPRLYAASTNRLANRLKLAFPWLVGLTQTAAQSALGQPRPPSRLAWVTSTAVVGHKLFVCLCPDVNFLILRTAIAYVAPLAATITLLFLIASHIRAKTSRRQFETSHCEHLLANGHVKSGRETGEGGNCIQMSTENRTSLLRESPIMNCISVRRQFATHGPNSVITEQLSTPLSIVVSIDGHNSTAIDGDHVLLETGQDVSVDKCLDFVSHFCPQHGHIRLGVEAYPSPSDDSECQQASQPFTTSLGRIEDASSSPKSSHLSLKETASTVLLNTIQCAVCISLWTPYFMATLVQGLTSQLITLQTLVWLKWLAFWSPVVQPLACYLIEPRLRRAVGHLIGRNRRVV